MKYVCNECDSEFVTDRASVCLNCGSSDIVCMEETTPVPSPEAVLCDNTEEVKGILGQLCMSTYDCSFRGVEWEMSIDRTLERLRPFLKAEKIVV